MAVKRIVANIAADPQLIETAKAFYRDMFDLDIAMDHGWIATLTGSGASMPQLSIAIEGGSGTAVPNVSIEVDNLDEVVKRLEQNGISIEYGPVLEPWGVRRFYVRDPLGSLLNILEHA
ncbi:VOC family protein [Hoeflea sp. AS60]|uniref:VOC family protein n=1 Tax=Hoeflea sp. AS60 TaxID=3135780 RepID=UPI0031755111